MPRPAGSKTGYDYSSIRQTHNSSDLQKRDNNTFQTISALIDGAETFQGFINNQFPQLDGSLSSLFNAVQEIQAELLDRQNSKYDLSLTNSIAQSIPGGGIDTIITFDTAVLNDGLLWDEAIPSQIKINHHAYWQFYGWVTVCTPVNAYFQITVKVNGESQIHSAISTPGKCALPFVGGIEVLRNDIVTLEVHHNASTNIDVLAHFQAHRISWIANRNASGRRVPATIDDEICDENTGTDDCICNHVGVQYAVLPQSKATYFLDVDGKLISQTPVPTIVADKASTFCALRNGNFLIAIDDSVTGFTRLEERKVNGALVVSYNLPIRIGQGPIGGYHSLLEEPCGMVLSVNRATHDLTEYDLTTNGISRILGLNIDPLDGAINQIGNRLVYVNGTALSVWDLVADAPLEDIIDFGFAILWPTWLADCSIIVYTGTYLGNGDFRIVMIDGTTVSTITYDQSRFPNGLIGYAANLSLDALWIVGLDALNRPGTLKVELSTGNEIGFQSFNFAPTVVNETAMVGSVYYPVKCTITNA